MTAPSSRPAPRIPPTCTGWRPEAENPGPGPGESRLCESISCHSDCCGCGVMVTWPVLNRSNRVTRRILTGLSFLALLVPRVAAQTTADSTARRQTALDYIEGYYEGNADRMARAVHGELAKRIVIRDPQRAHEFVREMGATELIEATRAGGGSKMPADRKRKDVTILDIS